LSRFGSAFLTLHRLPFTDCKSEEEAECQAAAWSGNKEKKAPPHQLRVLGIVEAVDRCLRLLGRRHLRGA
jgi:hypothetical protein